MGKITVELIRRRAEHNEGDIQSLEEISLHQEKLERIELLDRVCRNLKILLMQNNSISKIENVSRLKNLEYLNLALNMVEKIENLEGCESLKKLDLTLNFVGDISSVVNLSPNYYLEQLYMVGNPCHDFPGYRAYIITVLPQLKQLDGVEITKSERFLARQTFQETEATILLHQDAYLRERDQGKLPSGNDESKNNNESTPTNPKMTKVSSEKVTKISVVEDEEDIDDDETFWSQMTENTPEARSAMNQRLEKQDAEKAASKKSPLAKPKFPRRLETDDGRPLNINEPKLSFILHDEVERNQIVLDLAVPRFLCITLIDADVQPTYVRVTVKGKIFQLVLPEEVRPDSSYAQRSQTTGHLIVTMPKVHEHSTLVWRGGSGPLIELGKGGNKKLSVVASSQKIVDTTPAPLDGNRDIKVVKQVPSKPQKVGSVGKASPRGSDAFSVPVLSPTAATPPPNMTSPKTGKKKSGNKTVKAKGNNDLSKNYPSRWNVDDVPALM
ncbi:Protein tilB [Folsomia candida]|uniref:Protein tilB n=1 Tax=Folsomia candida TaxID=158441 RepID=A0A226E4Y4_FOLCA|nr:Protein tilB [Folsomia candida]